MNVKHSIGIRRFFLIFALLIPLTFAVPVTAATSQCTTTITTASPTNTVIRTFTYIVWGSITGDWNSAFTLIVRGVTYNVTTATHCAPR